MKLTGKRRMVLAALDRLGQHGATAAEIGGYWRRDARWARDGLSALVSYCGYAKTIGAGHQGSTLYAITIAGRLALSQEQNDD